MKKKGLFLLAIAGLVTFVLFSCGKKEKTPTNPTNQNPGFDKTAMLTYYADNLIIPGYKALQEKMVSLKTASDVFVSAPSASTQASLKTAYKEAYLQYERVAAFQFGPAETALLDNFLNYSGGLDYSFSTAGQLTGFSVDTATIESNINSGTYNLATTTRNILYSQGFPALEYLYFSPAAIQKFSTNTAKRVKYVNDVVDRMKTLVDGVSNSWTNYRAEFVANTQSNVGSPLGNLVNQLAYQIDLMKGPRIGWPFGKQSNGTVFADKCEGYYSALSLTLAIENLTALRTLYTANGSGKGISDYLVSLKNETLSNDVLAQIDLAISKLREIPDPLSASFTAQPAKVDAAYKEIQKLVTYIKTDVASATAVQLTYTDNDGD